LPCHLPFLFLSRSHKDQVVCILFLVRRTRFHPSSTTIYPLGSLFETRGSMKREMLHSAHIYSTAIIRIYRHTGGGKGNLFKRINNAKIYILYTVRKKKESLRESLSWGVHSHRSEHNVRFRIVSFRSPSSHTLTSGIKGVVEEAD